MCIDKLYITIYLSIYLSISLSLSIYLSIYLSITEGTPPPPTLGGGGQWGGDYEVGNRGNPNDRFGRGRGEFRKPPL